MKHVIRVGHSCKDFPSMTIYRIFLAAVLLISFALACEESKEPAGPDSLGASALVGNWTATKYELTNQANNAQKIDIIDLWLSYSMEIKANGRFTFLKITTSFEQTTDTGILRIQGEKLIMKFDGNATEYSVAFSLSRNTLILTDDKASSWDFDSDGTSEPATAVLVFHRK